MTKPKIMTVAEFLASLDTLIEAVDARVMTGPTLMAQLPDFILGKETQLPSFIDEVRARKKPVNTDPFPTPSDLRLWFSERENAERASAMVADINKFVGTGGLIAEYVQYLEGTITQLDDLLSGRWQARRDRTLQKAFDEVKP